MQGWRWRCLRAHWAGLTRLGRTGFSGIGVDRFAVRQANQFAGQNPGIQALAALAVGAGALPGLYSTYDVLSGPTHGLNSGEIPLNVLIGLMPMATQLAGIGAARALSPAARLASETDSLQLLRQLGVEPAPEVKANYAQEAAKLIAIEQAASKQGMSQAQAMEAINRRGRRNLYGSGLAGSLAGAIPAVMLMADRPAEASGRQG